MSEKLKWKKLDDFEEYLLQPVKHNMELWSLTETL